MRKFVVAIAVVMLVAFAAPAFAATEWFTDVPLNHWAYDVIRQLHARDLVVGYPDNTYKGGQPITRYEMATLIFRLLAHIDSMTRAEIERLKELVNEFGDELEALGARVEDLGIKVDKLQERLGGWKISGRLRLDFNVWDEATSSGGTKTDGRLFFDRWFGEDEKYHFHARVTNDWGNGMELRFTRFFVEMPGWWDSTITVGRWAIAWEEDYYWSDGSAYDVGYFSTMSDFGMDGVQLEKSFGMGKFRMRLGKHGGLDPWDDLTAGVTNTVSQLSQIRPAISFRAWDVAAFGQFQFTEKFGFDLGVDYLFSPDDISLANALANTAGVSYPLESLLTVWGGIRFNFNDNIALKGIYYHQSSSWDNQYFPAGFEADNGSSWRAIIDIKQDLLKFTSLWLEYGQQSAEFVHVGDGLKRNMIHDTPMWFEDTNYLTWGGMRFGDTKVWRIATRQAWTDKWTTWLWYNMYDGEDDMKAGQLGLAIGYTFNENLSMVLSYAALDYNRTANAPWSIGTGTTAVQFPGHVDQSLIRLRTQVVF